MKEIVKILENVDALVPLIEQLRGGLDKRLPPDELRKFLGAMMADLPFIGVDIEDITIYRGRSDTSDLLRNTADFSFNPKTNGYGRCHMPGETIFYGANNLETVFSELDLRIGDTVQVGIAKLLPGKGLVTILLNAIDYRRRYGQMPFPFNKPPTEEAYQQWYNGANEVKRLHSSLVSAFITDRFSQRVIKPQDYILTALIAQWAFKKATDGNGTKLHAIAYPSVAHRGGLNYAIQPSAVKEIIKWEGFRVYRVHKNFGYGLYGTHKYDEAKKIQTDGQIIWESDSLT